MSHQWIPTETDAWLVPLLSKRSPDACRILCDLIEAGLRQGHCSANDIRDVRFEQVNVIGGVFRVLHHFGFSHTDNRVKTTASRKHARKVDVWVMTNRAKAEQFISFQRKMLIGATNETQEMLKL